MFIIELKFFGTFWRDYFDKQYTKEEAFELFNNLVKQYPDSGWRLVYIERIP